MVISDLLSLMDEDPFSRRENEVGVRFIPPTAVMAVPAVVEVVVLSLHFLRLLASLLKDFRVQTFLMAGYLVNFAPKSANFFMAPAVS